MAIETRLAEPVARFTQRPHRLLIGGDWVEAAGGKTFPTNDPASGEEIAAVSYAEAADVDRAVEAAREAFESGIWSRQKTAAARERVILRIAELIEQHADELA